VATEVLVGIDLGTGSSKGVLAAPDGTVLATAARSRPGSMSMPRPNWAEVDPVRVWWEDVACLARELAGKAGSNRVAGVCVSGVGPSLVLTDVRDVPVRPAILYGIDMRASAEIAELTSRYGEEAIVARGGTALSSQAVGPKLLWTRRHEPAAWARAARWFNSSSYIVRKLTGEYILDHHTASQCDPLYDIHRQSWFRPWYDEVAGNLPAPRLAWPAEVVGQVTATAAAETGLPVGTPVCAGTIDAWAEAFSVGVRRPGDLMLMYGSTMFLVQVLRDFAAHPLLWATCGVEPGSRTIAAGMSTSGTLMSWIRDFAGGPSYETLIQQAGELPPGSNGLLVLPYFAGERTPVFDPRARGVIAGLHLSHTPAHVFRAGYEGIAFGIRQILELLAASAGPADRVVAVGGGTQGGLWTQIVSDVIGRPQLIPAQTIGASYGDALMAAIGTGLVEPDTDWTAAGHLVEPDTSAMRRYDELYQRYTALYPATAPVVHYLAELQEAGPEEPGIVAHAVAQQGPRAPATLHE
jgi:xylulokinase